MKVLDNISEWFVVLFSCSLKFYPRYGLRAQMGSKKIYANNDIVVSYCSSTKGTEVEQRTYEYSCIVCVTTIKTARSVNDGKKRACH